MDEFALMSPRTWTEVVRPAVSDKLGYVIFIGTPMGHNQFWDVYDFAKRTGKDWYAQLYRASETDENFYLMNLGVAQIIVPKEWFPALVDEVLRFKKEIEND